MSTPLNQLLKQSDRPLEICVKFILFWIAACDGDISREELAFIHQAMSNSDHPDELEIIKQAIYDQDYSAFHIVAYSLQHILDEKAKTAFMALAIMVAVADGRLALSENLILRFLSDLLNLHPRQLPDMYQEIAGQPLPAVGDPSSKAWWNAQERKAQSSQQQKQQEYRRPGTRPTSDMTRAEAYVVLGLTGEPSPDEIKKAYRRMAQSHHPDRYQSLGPDAIRTAEIMFQRIQTAYEVLKP